MNLIDRMLCETLRNRQIFAVCLAVILFVSGVSVSMALDRVLHGGVTALIAIGITGLAAWCLIWAINLNDQIKALKQPETQASSP